MRHIIMALGVAVALVFPATAYAQIGLPGLPLPNTRSPQTQLPTHLEPVLDDISEPAVLDRLNRSELRRLLAHARDVRINRFMHENRDYIERDRNGDPAVRGVLVASGIMESEIAKAQQAGFRLIGTERIDALDFAIARFGIPAGTDLGEAERDLVDLLPGAGIAADTIYFRAGYFRAGGAVQTTMLKSSYALTSAEQPLARISVGSAKPSPRIGMIDGGIAKHRSLPDSIVQRGFATGAPYADGHGTAVASLLVGINGLNGAAQGFSLMAADVYGTDAAGGNATAIVRALGWMVQSRVPVVVVSLVGPDNPVLRRAVAAAQDRGVMVVAAIGNDGPAAPASYPAAYRGVFSITGVDERNRALPEASIATRVDFAAPGSKLRVAGLDGDVVTVRGTSFAAPLAAARLAYHYPLIDTSRIEQAVLGLAAEARDLGKKGRDRSYGLGLVCEDCRSR